MRRTVSSQFFDPESCQTREGLTDVEDDAWAEEDIVSCLSAAVLETGEGSSGRTAESMKFHESLHETGPLATPAHPFSYLSNRCGSSAHFYQAA